MNKQLRAGIVLLFASVAAWLAVAAAQMPSVGQVARLVPRVDAVRLNKTVHLREQDPVSENDRVRTAAGGRTRIVLNDGSILNVGSASEMTIRTLAGTSQVSQVLLSYGRIRGFIAKRAAGQPLEIRTRTAVCGVLGTIIFVDASRDVTRVANVSDDQVSRVRVTSTTGITQEVILLPGEGTSVPAGRGPQPPRRWTREEMQAAYDDTNI